MTLPSSGWQESRTDIFWAEIAPCEHVLQIYENDAVFMDALSGYVGGGINAGECVIVIATTAHLNALEQRLLDHGIRVDTLVKDERYIPLNAEEILDKFMVNGWPDEDLFMTIVSGLVSSAACRNRKVRVFGELVAILWAKGLAGATVKLEHLWDTFCSKQSFSLLCAYPKTGFTQNIKTSIGDICGCHSKIISGEGTAKNTVLYKDSDTIGVAV